MERSNTVENFEKLNVSGQLSKRRTWAPLKVLATVTGISLVGGLGLLAARYLLWLRSSATATLAEKKITVSVAYSIFGKIFRESKTITPLSKVCGVQLEKRYRYMQFIVGFGFLVVGVFAGVHWLLDGLGAGYPYLALIGAGVILGGVIIDLLLYSFIPVTEGRHSVIVATAGWNFRITGVSDADAEHFVNTISEQLPSSIADGNAPTAE